MSCRSPEDYPCRLSRDQVMMAAAETIYSRRKSVAKNTCVRAMAVSPSALNDILRSPVCSATN